jgi:hypothetical protein
VMREPDEDDFPCHLRVPSRPDRGSRCPGRSRRRARRR